MIKTVKQIKNILDQHSDNDEVFIENPHSENSVYSIDLSKSGIARMIILHKNNEKSRIDIYSNPI